MSDTRRDHLEPKKYRTRRTKIKTARGDAQVLKTPKQLRAARRRELDRAIHAA